jgi:hypothetical protein
MIVRAGAVWGALRHRTEATLTSDLFNSGRELRGLQPLSF